MEQVLNNEVLRTVAPSVFADHAQAGVSDRYSFLPTIKVVDGMREAGWSVVKAQEQRIVTEERRGFQKHMLRFRRNDDVQRVAALTTRENHNVDRLNPLAEFPEIILTNSHDRSSAYQLHAGIFRLVCSNGLVIADSTFGKISIRHANFNPDDVINASFKVIEEIPAVMSEIDCMKTKQLSAPAQTAFAEAALILKYDDLKAAPVEARNVLATRRHEDNKSDLWTTFNRVQENLTKGGLKNRQKKNDAGKNFRRTTPVKSISENIALNKALWHLAKTLGLAL